MKFNVGSQLLYCVEQPGALVLNISAVNSSHQTILQERLQIDPVTESEEFTAAEEGTRFIRIKSVPGELKICYEATVEVFPETLDPAGLAVTLPADLPVAVLKYLYPSRYCESDRLVTLATQEFGQFNRGYPQVAAICDWIHDKITYLSGSTDSQTSAHDTATERAGVCRDFAHLGIALCRALEIPARFVSGYAYGLEPPDFHACFEAFLGDRWYLFDATRLVPLEGFVRIGTGRDAVDTAFATIWGQVQMQNMAISIEPADQQANLAKLKATSPQGAIAIS